MAYRPDLVIYHGDCMDGWTAAWVCARKWPGVLLHPGKYGEQYPAQGLHSVEGKHVLLVDFSYKRPVLERMYTHHGAKSVVVLDHHKSALQDLEAFAQPEHVVREQAAEFMIDDELIKWGLPVVALFDMERSGAGMAWDFCYPNAERTMLVNYVEDRDLWHFVFPQSRQINAYIASFSFGLEEWDDLENDLEQEKGLAMAALAGAAIERKKMRDLDEMLPSLIRRFYIGGFEVPVANLSYIFASDAGNKLAHGEPFAATYFDNGDGYRHFSLRAVEGGEDVSKIAAEYGGGGHAKASGFRIKRGSCQISGISDELVS